MCIRDSLGYAALHNFSPELDGLAGVFTGTYIGGTVNFAALGAAFEAVSYTHLDVYKRQEFEMREFDLIHVHQPMVMGNVAKMCIRDRYLSDRNCL